MTRSSDRTAPRLWPWQLARMGVLLLALAAFVGLHSAGSASAANPKALILGSTVTPGSATDGSSKSLEEQQAQLDGFDTTVVSDTTWDSMTASQFAAYQVLIIGDPTCGDTTSPGMAAANNAAVWQHVVMSSGGNKVIIGTDPTFHHYSHPGAVTLENHGIAFAGAVAGATGAYIDISCESTYTTAGVPYTFLDGLTTHAPGSFTTEYPPCSSAISIVAASGPTSGLHDSDLRDWSCSVHQSFKTWPSDYTPLAIATDTPTKPYCANDVDTGAFVCGEPYILISGGGITVSSQISLTPKTATNAVGTDHTVTATIVDSNGHPVVGKTVTFTVESGPNAGQTGTGVTNSSGQTTFTYHDTGGAGTDTISAVFTNDAGAQERATATKTWVVGVGDHTPPTCALIATVNGPPKSIIVDVQDTGSGLASVVVTSSTNATTVVGPFVSGTTLPVVVTSIKNNQSLSSTLALKVTDVAGNTTVCDPVVPGTKASTHHRYHQLQRSLRRVALLTAQLFMKD